MWKIAVGAFLTAIAMGMPVAHAVECGPMIKTAKISQMHQSIRGIGQKILVHYELLNEEQKVLIDSPNPPSDALARLSRLQTDTGSIRSASESAERIFGLLDASIVLAQIRDQVSNVSDKQLVSAYLSHSLWRTGGMTQLVSRSISLSLANTSRPGFAVDIAKLRDIADEIAADTRQCTSPFATTERK